MNEDNADDPKLPIGERIRRLVARTQELDQSLRAMVALASVLRRDRDLWQALAYLFGVVSLVLAGALAVRW